MSRAVILVPLYRQRLTDDERLSLIHLLHYLGHREIVVLKPDGLTGTLDGRRTECFADGYFKSVDTYSRLLLSPAFYRRFERYEWLFLYQLDALALADRLDEWLDMPWDYIGAPWLVDMADPSQGFSRVGNGGFCLRRVEACLRVLEEGHAPRALEKGLCHGLSSHRLPDQRHSPPITRLVKTLQVLRQAARGVTWYAGQYTLNEDHFWCDRAHLFGTGFSVAPVSAGLRFAFEHSPRLAYEQSGQRLPFGTHAWAKHDPDFWAPHLLSDDISMSSAP